MESNREGEPSLKWWVLGILAVLVLNAFALFWGLGNWADRGTFGDMFGLANALFSGLAFAGVIYAIMLQKKELSLQRDELQLTREELRGQKKELERQNVNLERQSFRATFFEMVRLHHEIIQQLDGGHSTKGRVALEWCYRELIKKVKSVANSRDLVSVSSELFRGLPGVWGVYLQNFAAIVRLTADQPEEKTRFLFRDLLFSQVTNQEKVLLLYYLHCDEEDWGAAMTLKLYDGIDETLLSKAGDHDLLERRQP